MNVHDSRRIEEVLEQTGYAAAASAEQADVLLFNTCSVREKAEHKVLSVLGRVREIKQQYPSMIVVVAGCVAQQEGEQLLKKSPIVDLVLGPDNIPELPGLITYLQQGGPRLARTVFDTDSPQFLNATPRQGHKEVTAFVTTMKGCDERCTYCVVPYTRGPERYRPAEQIIEEIRQLVAGGTKEVTLLGQTVNSWIDPNCATSGNSQFAKLLFRISEEVPELKRLRYTSPHPRHLNDELMYAHQQIAMLPRHLHLPVQSGSDFILKRMLRRYRSDQYVERVKKLQQLVPDLTLSTDIIVGFPGETEQDFQQTLSLVKQVGFVAAFAFKYSQRPNTPALRLGDDVSEKEKDDRLARLFSVVEQQQQDHLNTLVGTQQQVLIEGASRDGSPRYSGRSERNEIVHVETNHIAPIGEILDVEIVEANRHSLRALDLKTYPAAQQPIQQVTQSGLRLPVLS